MKRLQIGKININDAILLAPMEGITDIPFRLICKELGADIVYTEFVASEALVRDVPKSFKKIQLDERERPVAIQIFGNNPENMATSAKIAENLGADFIDINYGCWVKKVVNNNAGSALMKDPELMYKITNECVKAVNVPITIKTRLGWDSENINIMEIAKMQEDAGARAITVHCRTRQQKISGDVDWSYIPQIKENINIPLILNGNVTTPELALAAMQTPGADGVMIARGAVGNPFIFREAKLIIKEANNGNGIIKKTIDVDKIIKERIDYCLKHLQLNIEYKGEQGLLEFRKYYSGYLRGLYNAGQIRKKLVLEKNIDEIRKIIFEYYDFLKSNEKLEISNICETHRVTCRRSL